MGKQNIRIRIKDLTSEAAIEDAKLIIDKCFFHIEKIIRLVMEDYNSHYGGAPRFHEILKAALTYNLLNRLSTEKAEKTSNLIMNSILSGGVLVYEMQNLYSFARGEDYNSEQAQEFRFTILNVLFSSVFSDMQNGGFSYSFMSLEQSFPRIAFALRIVDTRIHIKYQIEENGIENTFITPQMLADLADVSYVAIRKYIRLKRVIATKHNREWQIPLEFALEWLNKRKAKKRKYKK